MTTAEIRRIRELLRVADHERRARYSCKVCGAVPDEEGAIEHGRGCFRYSEDGGGTSYEEVPEDPLLTALSDLLAVAESTVATGDWRDVCVDMIRLHRDREAFELLCEAAALGAFTVQAGQLVTSDVGSRNGGVVKVNILNRSPEAVSLVVMQTHKEPK